jgi:hypothetical protein
VSLHDPTGERSGLPASVRHSKKRSTDKATPTNKPSQKYSPIQKRSQTSPDTSTQKLQNQTLDNAYSFRDGLPCYFFGFFRSANSGMGLDSVAHVVQRSLSLVTRSGFSAARLLSSTRSRFRSYSSQAAGSEAFFVTSFQSPSRMAACFSCSQNSVRERVSSGLRNVGSRLSPRRALTG